MKNIIAFCRTPVQIIRVVQLNHIWFKNDNVVLFIFDSFRNSETIKKNIEQLGIFKEVHYIHDEDYTLSLKGKMTDAVSFLKKSEFTKILKELDCDEFYTCNLFGVFNELAFNILKKRNPTMSYNMIEDGPALYYVERISSATKRYLYKLLGLKDTLDNIDNWLFSKPDEMLTIGNGRKIELPILDVNDCELKGILNTIFDFELPKNIAEAKVIFMEECYFNDGLLTNNKDYETFEEIQLAIGRETCVVKLHPRTRENRFKEDFNIVQDDGKPWELYALNMNMSEKILVSISCGTMLSTKLLLGYETKSLLMYPMFVSDVIDKKGNYYLNDDRIAQLIKQQDYYNDKSHFYIAETTSQAIEKIKDWTHEV